MTSVVEAWAAAEDDSDELELDNAQLTESPVIVTYIVTGLVSTQEVSGLFST